MSSIIKRMFSNTNASVKYAFLNLKGHPRGNLILKILVNKSFLPSLVIEEDSKMAQKGRDALNEELRKLPNADDLLPPEMSTILEPHPEVKHLQVRNHNNEATLEAIAQAEIDVIVLGDCRIMKDPIIKLAKKGMINTHPGYLPHVRGNNCSLYAIIHDLPIGCTAHVVDLDIDTGPLIEREKLDLDWKNMTYPMLLHELNLSCARLALHSMHQFAQMGSFQSKDQNDFMLQSGLQLHPYGTFTAIEPIMKKHAIQKLESGGYSGGSIVPVSKRGEKILMMEDQSKKELGALSG
eukprot:snap_masked-scaffold_16-processed-gene-1.57-mRNA-1 protein AED:1.00 eAED:1.00 QI:0/-1/0/0/-1/1/1/0/293